MNISTYKQTINKRVKAKIFEDVTKFEKSKLSKNPLNGFFSSLFDASDEPSLCQAFEDISDYILEYPCEIQFFEGFHFFEFIKDIFDGDPSNHLIVSMLTCCCSIAYKQNSVFINKDDFLTSVLQFLSIEQPVSIINLSLYFITELFKGDFLDYELNKIKNSKNQLLNIFPNKNQFFCSEHPTKKLISDAPKYSMNNLGNSISSHIISTLNHVSLNTFSVLYANTWGKNGGGNSSDYFSNSVPNNFLINSTFFLIFEKVMEIENYVQHGHLKEIKYYVYAALSSFFITSASLAVLDRDGIIEQVYFKILKALEYFDSSSESVLYLLFNMITSDKRKFFIRKWNNPNSLETLVNHKIFGNQNEMSNYHDLNNDFGQNNTYLNDNSQFFLSDSIVDAILCLLQENVFDVLYVIREISSNSSCFGSSSISQLLECFQRIIDTTQNSHDTYFENFNEVVFEILAKLATHRTHVKKIPFSLIEAGINAFFYESFRVKEASVEFISTLLLYSSHDYTSAIVDAFPDLIDFYMENAGSQDLENDTFGHNFENLTHLMNGVMNRLIKFNIIQNDASDLIEETSFNQYGICQ